MLRKRLDEERGIAMIVTLLVFMVISSISIAVVQIASHDTGNSAYNVKRDQALQAAQGGVDAYIASLNTLLGNSVCTGGPAAGTNTLSAAPLITYAVSVRAYEAGNSATDRCPSDVTGRDLGGGRLVVTAMGTAGSPPQQVTRKWQTTVNLSTIYSNQNLYAIRAGVNVDITGGGIIKAYPNCLSLPGWPSSLPCANNASVYSDGNVTWSGNFQLEGSLAAKGNITVANGYIWGNISSGGDITYAGSGWTAFTPAPTPLLTYTCDAAGNVGVGAGFPVTGSGTYAGGSGWAVYPCFGNVTATGRIIWTGSGKAFGSCKMGVGPVPFTNPGSSQCTQQPKTLTTGAGAMTDCGSTLGSTWGGFPMNDTLEPCGKVVSPAPAPPTAPPDPMEVWNDLLIHPAGCAVGSYPCYTISNYTGAAGTLSALGSLPAKINNASDASWNVTETAASPATPFEIQIESEKMLVTTATLGMQTPDTYTVVRGYAGTTASSHPINTAVSLVTGDGTCGKALGDIKTWGGGGSVPGWNNAATHADNAVHITSAGCTLDLTSANLALRGNLLIGNEGNFKLNKANVSSATGAGQCTGGLPGYLGDQCTFGLIVPYVAGRACGPMTPGVLGPYGYTSENLTSITTVNVHLYTQCDVYFANNSNTTGQIFAGKVDLHNNGTLIFVPSQVPFIKPVPSGYQAAPIYFRECKSGTNC